MSIGRRGFIGSLLALPAAAKAWAPAIGSEIVIPIAPVASPVLKAGDVFTIEGFLASNPSDYGRLRQFVVTADVTSE